MSIIKSYLFWIALVLGSNLSSISVYGQRKELDSLLISSIEIDTSDYIALIYEDALNYNLMIAASKGYHSEIKRLIEKGAEINARTTEGASPLIFAVSNSRLTAVNTILKYNPDVDLVTQNGETPLLIAVKNSDLEIAEALIRAGADVDIPDWNGATPLHHSSINGFLEMTDMLLYYDAEINAETDEGSTPLHTSVWSGYTDVSDLLIQRGADIRAKDSYGFTPYLLAAYCGDTIIMDILQKRGSDIYTRNNYEQNALTLAIVAGNKLTTGYLLKKGRDWDKPENDTISPYLAASKYSRKEIVDLLKQNNIKGDIKYQIDQIRIELSAKFNLHDFYTGFNLSFKEPYLNAGIIGGIDTKLWYTKVFIKDSETLYYQFREKGSVVWAGLFKDFNLTDNLDKMNIVFSTTLAGGYSFGNNLKGTLSTPEEKFRLMPSLSFKFLMKYIIVSAGAEYMKSEYYRNGPVWFRAGISYNYYFDNIRTRIKPVNWH